MHRFTMVEHAVEQRRAHRNMLMQLRQSSDPTRQEESAPCSASGANALDESSDDSDSEEEQSEISEEEMDMDGFYFLQVCRQLGNYFITLCHFLIHSYNLFVLLFTACANKTETCIIKSSWCKKN